MPRLTPARCSVQIGQTGSVVGKLVARRPRADLTPLGNFRCTSAVQTHNLKVIGSNPIPATRLPRLLNELAGFSFKRGSWESHRVNTMSTKPSAADGLRDPYCTFESFSLRQPAQGGVFSRRFHWQLSPVDVAISSSRSGLRSGIAAPLFSETPFSLRTSGLRPFGTVLYLSSFSGKGSRFSRVGESL
jgi:hypothetical protein